ncbi:hypothetical protein BV25DRAFT_1912367 [Artomyces pyxidatus]|uniref:Uncharacterized protein n=1 Tax=Artomyces pyxidatus TaxID=48021 RepID=A0ACB8TF31_9AGAM|nr:hypothetical protein BV25DRAFT_1912367 [Artomyces pyxidatus]
MAEDKHANGQKDESYGDASAKLWNMYMEQAGEYDKALSESWKGDTDGIIVFTGLFSATVAAFLIESYKQLSADSGDATVQLLGQLLNQTAIASRGLVVDFAKPLPTFQPTASAIRVNAMWFTSLILSITCALAATLMQQWARQYRQVTQRQAAPHRRARIRAYLFEGVERFGMARAVEYLPTLLHASVFLFFTGLFDFMLAINTIVAWTIFLFTFLSASAYGLFSLHPIVHLSSPFRTPMSRLLWPSSHIIVAVVMWLSKTALAPFEYTPGTLPAPTASVHSTHKLRRVALWRAYMRYVIRICRGRLHAGLQRSIEKAAMDAPWAIDSRALKWAIERLDEEHEWQQFVDAVPNFSNSKAVKDKDDILVDLMIPGPEDDLLPRFAARISSLLDTCAPEAGGLEKDTRIRRLLSCVLTLCHITELYARMDREIPYHMLVLFGDPPVTRMLRDETNPRIVVSGRCMGALLAHCIIRDRKRPTMSDKPPRRFSEGESQSLAVLLEEPSHVVSGYLVDESAGFANLVSVVRGTLPILASQLMSTDITDIVMRTITFLSKNITVADTQKQVQDDFVRVWFDVENHANEAVPDARYTSRCEELAEILHPIYKSLSSSRQPTPALSATLYASSSASLSYIPSTQSTPFLVVPDVGNAGSIGGSDVS